VIKFTVEETGWLFERPDIEGAVVPAVQEATRLVFDHARGILAAHPGPGHYGHSMDAIAQETRHAEGIGITGRVYGKGKAAFKLIFLEGGTAGHYIPPKGGRGVLAYQKGGELRFRPYAHHPGTKGIQWKTRTQVETSYPVRQLIEDAVRRATEQ